MSAIDDLLAGKGNDAPESSVAGPQGLGPAAQKQQQSAVDELLASHGGSYATGQSTDMTGTMRSWYTGQNLGATPGVTESGTANGWDTQFQQVFQKQSDEAYKRGDIADFFTRDDATGVVTWDNAKGKNGESLKWGDVIVQNKKVANVYDDFDRHTANVMMGSYVLDNGDQAASLSEGSDFKTKWDEEISARRNTRTQMAAVAPAAAEFEKNTKEELAQDEGKDRFGVVLGGAVGGAGLGSVAGPWGTVAGALVGGIGAWLNSDSLAYQWERNQEKYRIASAEGASITAALDIAGQTAMSVGLSPLTNLLQGTYDVTRGDGGVGGGAIGGAFYETNAEGQRKASFGWQAADMATVLGDSVLQFSSIAGRLAFQASMGASVGGGLSGFVTGAWDDRAVKMNSIWMSDSVDPVTGEVTSSFDLGNALAGIGNVGIDAVQLGMISSLSRQTDRLASQVAARTGLDAAKLAKPFNGNRFLERLNLDKAQRAAVKDGAEIETRSGFKFVVTEGGELVGKARGTLAMLAPSEGLQALSAKALARRDAARLQGAVTSEQLYQAASDLAIGQRGIQAILMNAVGEGQEEFAQGLLEPWSQDYAVDADSLIRSTLAGMASGAGMTFGARLGRPNQDQQMFTIAAMGWASQTNGERLSYDQWNQLNHLEKRTLVKSAGALARSLTDGAYDKIEKDRIEGVTGSVIEAARYEDHIRDEDEAALKSGTVATDQASPIVMHESSTFRPDALATSHTQLLINQQDRTIGSRTQLERLGTELAQSRSTSTADPANTELATRVAALQAEHDTLTEVVNESVRLEETIRLTVEAIDAKFATKDEADLADAEVMIDGLNDSLESMYDMVGNDFELVVDGRLQRVTLTDAQVFSLSKAVSRLATRDPADSTGSWQVMLPQVNKVYALRGANGVYAVSQIILQSIRGDYDGDKMRELQQVVFDDERWTAIRAGANILGVGNMPEIGSTKFEKAVADLAMQVWDSSNGPLRQASRKIAQDIEADLLERYHNDTTGMKPIGRNVITEVSQAVHKALASGGDVREMVLTIMSARAGGALQEIGRGRYWSPGLPKLSNEMYWMANMVTRHMQEFQSFYAEHTPNKGTPDGSFQVVSASETTTDVRIQRPRWGATPGQTAAQALPGSQMFRIFQKLHYTAWETTDKFVGFGIEHRDEQFQQLVEFYERLSQGVIDQRLDRKSPSDAIISQVMAWLEQGATDQMELKRLGLTETADMALLANVAVGQMVYKVNEAGERHLFSTGKEVTYAQHLLYLSLEKFKVESRQVWDRDTDRRAAYNALMELTKPPTQGDESSHPGNAEMAFVKVFESTRLYDIVGVDAVSLGINRTVGQVYREMRALSVEERRASKYRARSGAYQESEKSTIPFRATEIEDRSVTPYKALVDSLFSAADSSLSMNLTGKDRGKVTGRDAKKSERRGKAIQEAYAEVAALLQRLYPKTGKYTAEDISRIANENREFGTALMKTIPEKAMPWVVRRQLPNGNVVFAKWFYEVWTQPTAEQAEMSYFRNITLDPWYAKVRALDIDFSNSTEEADRKRIEFDSLDSRMHRVLFRLASRSVVDSETGFDPYSLNGFLAKFNEASSVEEFMRWVNTQEGLISEGAPLLPWMDDVAEFDPDKAGGGWSSKLTTPTLMEHINDLKSTAQRMIKDLDRSNERSRLDVNTARSIEKWYRHLQDPDNANLKYGREDEANYGRFVALLESAAKRRMANGPRAMLEHTAHLVHGMYAPAHAKGQNADQMAANAALEAMDNAIGYLIPAERVMGDLTAHNEDAVADAPQMLLRDGGRMMNRHGSQVAWQLNSVEAMLPLMTDPTKHNMMRAVLFDTVIELDPDGKARRKFLMGSTLDEVMTRNTAKDLFDDNGRSPGLTKSMQFLVKVEAELRDTQKHELEQKVTELVIARTSALDYTADFEEIHSMTVQAYLDFAQVLQTVGRTRKRRKEEDPVILAYRKLKDAARVLSIAKAYGIDPEIIKGSLSDLQVIIQEQMTRPHQDRIELLRAQLLESDITKTRAAEIAERLQAEESVRDEMDAKIVRIFDLNVTDSIVEEFFYNEKAGAAEKHARQTKLMEYVYNHGELMQASGPAMLTVQAIKNHFGETARGRKSDPLKLVEADWETLSNVIISVEIQHLLTVGPASKPPPPYPAALKKGQKGLNKRKYWDHSFSFLFDFLSEDDNTGIVVAARKIAKQGGMAQAQFGEADVIRKVTDVLMREGSLGQWTPELPIQAIESYDLLTGASAVPSISMHGLISQRWGAAMEASRRNTTQTLADTTVKLTAHDLDWQTTGAFHDVEVVRDDGQKFQRPLAQMNNRFASELSFTYGNDTTPVDLMLRPNVARMWLPAQGEQGSADFREVNITRMAEEIERALQEMYPGTKPAAMRKMLDSVEVTMKFVNPDSQPDTADHANSVWHEGTVYSSDGDVGDSLLKAFFYGVGGLNPLGQQAALDTRKLGLMGIEDYQRPAFSDVLQIEKENKGTDFARMLALKTNILMDTPISEGKPVDVEFYNAAYKLMKLKHWVDGVDRVTNERVRLSAEQVIAWQMANPETDSKKKGPSKDFFGPEGPLRDAELWIPSDQVLANMMGDIGYGGVTGRALRTEQTDDLTTIKRYESRWTDHMEGMFSVETSRPVTIMDTDVARQSFVQDVRANSQVTSQEQMRFQRRVEAMEYKKSFALQDRVKAAQRTTFDPAGNRKKNLDIAVGWVASSDVDLPGLPDQMRYLEREHGEIQTRTLMGLQRYMEEQEGRAASIGSSFWIFQEKGTSSADEGRLTKGDLTGGLSLVPGEVVAFDTAAYKYMDPKKARALAMERVEFFVNRGVALMFVSSDGPNNLTSELQQLTMREHRYQRYLNNNAILVPDVFDQSTFQNVAAARSRLVSSSGVTPAKQRLSVLFRDKEVEENTMLIPVRKGWRSKFETIQAVFDMLPIDAYSDFNTSVTRDDAKKVQRYLENLGDEGVEMLRKSALGDLKGTERDTADAEFTESWKRLMKALPNRAAAGTTQPLVGEEFGTGDFIPLLNPLTNEVLLYRHGYRAPKPSSFGKQLRDQIPGGTGMRGIAVYDGEREPSATTHQGTVSRIQPAPGRGFRMELEVSVQSLGEKIVFEHNGMKYLKTNLPASIKVPALALFGDIDIDGYTSVHDTISKEATAGLVVSFGQAFTVFGIDFTQDLKNFFGLDSTDATISLLKRIAALGEKKSVTEVYQLQSMLAGQSALFSAVSGLLPQLAAAEVDSQLWGPRLQEDSVEAAIARAMLVYLMSPGADVDAVLGSSGFFIDNPTLAGAATQQMPELFTRAFDLSAPDSAVRSELSDRINAKLNKSADEAWYLDVNSWELEGIVKDGPAIYGMLQYGEAHSSDDNVLLNLMAQERKATQSTTRHQGLMNRIGIGGVTRTDQKRLNRLTGLRQQDLTDPEQVNSLWHDLTFVDPQTYGPGSRWQRRNPTEIAYYNRSIARMTQYRHRIDMDDKVFTDNRAAIDRGIDTIVNRLGLRPSQDDLVHYWIRQMLYHPAEGPDQSAFNGDMAPNDVLEAVRVIIENIEVGRFPTYDSTGPSFFAYDDLAVLFQAFQRGDSTWSPWRKEGDSKSAASAEDIGEWIAIAFGQAINDRVAFDPIYRLDFSGFMNTYQTVLRNSGYMMDITFDKEYQRKLLDPKTNELLSVTIDPVENTRLTEQVLFATANLEYDDLMRGAARGTDSASLGQSAAWRQRRLDARAKWRARHKVHPVKVQSGRDYARNGTELINKDADRHSLQRIVIALRHGMAMLNPGLYFSMIPEQGFRMYLSEATNLLTGESTLRSASALQRGIDKATGGRLELALYSKEQIDQLNELFKTLGNDGAFTSLLISDQMWKKNQESPGKIVTGFEKFAALGNKWQDPTWGTTQRSLARHYIEAIMRSIEAMPTRNVMTADSVIAALRTDPSYFAREHKELHQMASNAVIDFRSLKQTPMSMALRSLYEPWATSDNGLKRFGGTLLKLQLMYATYNMNVLTTITGMQGYSEMLAVFLDGKKKPGSLMSRLNKARNGEEASDEDNRTFDMSSTIDGVAMANAFIKGGVTQTGLFMLGMATGGILSGEDDEAKRRRRLAEAQNMPLIMDPRRLEMDFRNKDVIFLDWLPFNLSAFFRVQGDDGSQGARAAAQMSWILKPFLSPIIGMERFFQTGDFSWVTHGFLDAVGSLPLFNKGAWDDAVRTADELAALAAEEQKAATPTSTKNTLYLLTSAVGVYENMLLENMFINSLYTGFDMYDRDPSRLVLRDSDGDIQKTIEDDARKNNVALSQFPKDGEVTTGYMKRDALSAGLASRTENNLTLAAMLSLFKPIHHQEFFRGDMPVREQIIKMPALTTDEAKVAIILATLNQQKAQGVLERRLSLDEVTYLLKGKFMKDKDWDSYNNIDALAVKYYQSSDNPVDDPLSSLMPNGQEVLTKSGHVALFKGLMGGTIGLDDPQMQGIAITPEQRIELAKDFFEDMTREGRDMGLTQQQAQFRAQRLLYGPKDDPAVKGFNEILWDKRIPSTPNVRYKQLNTTYVTGPDGFPWATGYRRGGEPGNGMWYLLGGVKRANLGSNYSDAIGEDGRMNSADLVRAINPGLRGLVPMNATEEIPTDWEQTKKIIDSIKDHEVNVGKGYEPNSNGGTRGTFYRGGGGGGYSSKGYSPTIYWSRQPNLPRGTNVYGNTTRNLFWKNAYIRRTTIRRERYQSQRGRLNQWQ